MLKRDLSTGENRAFWKHVVEMAKKLENADWQQGAVDNAFHRATDKDKS